METPKGAVLTHRAQWTWAEEPLGWMRVMKERRQEGKWFQSHSSGGTTGSEKLPARCLPVFTLMRIGYDRTQSD